MNKAQLLYELEKVGYTIDIRLEGETKYVVLQGTCSKHPYELPRSYSDSYTDMEVRLDCAFDLMSWAGYRIVSKLELN